MFYLKLASTNLKKNHRGYLPFLISMLFLVAINTMTQVIVNNEGMRALPGGDSASSMFGLGHIVIMIFTVIFSFYTNSFLLKQRKKELGLYNILGLGKRELYQLMIWEKLPQLFHCADHWFNYRSCLIKASFSSLASADQRRK